MAITPVMSGPTAQSEYRLLALSTTAMVLTTENNKALCTIWVDNSLNAARTYLKIKNAETYDHAADDPDFVIPIPGGYKGEINANYFVTANTLALTFSTGICAAASSGPEPGDDAPASTFNCRIGVT